MNEEDQEQEGALAALIEKQNESRPFKVYPVDAIFRADGHKMEIAFQLLTIGEDDDAIRLAYKHLAAAAKLAGDGEERAKGDNTLSISATALEALWRVCRSVKKDGTPSLFAAFPAGPDWMRRNLRQDQVLALFNLYLATKREFALAPRILDEGAVDDLVPKLANIGSEEVPPEVWLASYDRGDMVSLAVLMAVRIQGAAHAVKLLTEDRDEAEATREAALAQVAALEERVAELLAEKDAASSPEATAAPAE